MHQHWVPIFDKHHVDFVLQGHDHAYQRTYPLHGHRRVDTPGHGTIYVIAVSGDKFVDRATRDYVKVGRSGVSTYQTIEIDSRSNRLTYRARTVNGTIVDELRIEKPREPRLKSAPAISGPTPTIAPTLTQAALRLERHDSVRPSPPQHPRQRDPAAPIGFRPPHDLNLDFINIFNR